MIAKILVADDNEELRTTLRSFLEELHHIVVEASDGAQAFTLADQEKPHLIITDVMMPGLYGSTAVKQLRSNKGTAGIPIIVMSGTVEKSVLGDLLEEPNITFLKKPIDLEILKEKIAEMLPKGGYTV